MEVEKIDRINALAHKAKSVGLTEEEKKERELLRKEYIASVRMNFALSWTIWMFSRKTEQSLIWVKDMESKKDIRKKIFAERKLRTDEQIEAMSLTITDKVTALPAFKNADRILVYADYNHEVVTEYLIKEAWKAGKEVAVPKVVGKDMVFYKLTDLARLEPGYFGIPEPVSGEIVNWSKALMIMPGVAFDRANHRVGYGGGFYDRYLEKHPQLERVAIAFSFQMLPEVPTEPTDICPQIIVTEEEICYLTD